MEYGFSGISTVHKHIMAYGSYAICRDDPEKNGGHIKSAQMTRSKCLR